jgi:hypothetical protein
VKTLLLAGVAAAGLTFGVATVQAETITQPFTDDAGFTEGGRCCSRRACRR